MGYFILGIFTIQFLFPIFEGITAVILTGLEALKGYFGTKVARYNRLINRDDEPKKRPIGFIQPTEEDEEDE